MTGENDKNNPAGSFSEEELASALANMENELNSILEDASGLPENGRKEAEKSNSDEKAGDLAGTIFRWICSTRSLKALRENAPNAL